jgi:hypothetical protein
VKIDRNIQSKSKNIFRHSWPTKWQSTIRQFGENTRRHLQFPCNEKLDDVQPTTFKPTMWQWYRFDELSFKPFLSGKKQFPNFMILWRLEKENVTFIWNRFRINYEASTWTAHFVIEKYLSYTGKRGNLAPGKNFWREKTLQSSLGVKYLVHFDVVTVDFVCTSFDASLLSRSKTSRSSSGSGWLLESKEVIRYYPATPLEQHALKKM